MENSIEEIEKNIIEIADSESRIIDDYIEKIYSRSVPKPIPPNKDDVSFLRLVGIEATGYTLAALSGALLSAVRTGGLFYLLEELLLKKFDLNPFFTIVFPLAVMIFALGAFEGYLLSDGFRKGKVKTEITSSKLGVGVAFTVIISAGVFSSLALFTMDTTIELIINAIVAVITGAGAGIITYCGGENIGFSVTLYDNKRKEIYKDYQNLYSEWMDSGIKAYNSSHYKVGSKRSSNFTQNLNSKNKISEKIQEEIKIEEPIQNDFKVHKNPSKYELCYSAISDFVKLYNRLPTFKELESSGHSSGYASLALNAFTVDNQSDLLMNNMINQERLNKAIEYMEKRNKTKENETDEQRIYGLMKTFINTNKFVPSASDLNEDISMNVYIEKFVEKNREILIKNGITIP